MLNIIKEKYVFTVQGKILTEVKLFLKVILSQSK